MNLQDDVNYWFEVCRLFMDNPAKQDEFEHAKVKLDEAISKRDAAKGEMK